MDRRTAREIIVKGELLNNKQINLKIGTVENRDFPQTVYINISFWIKPKEELINSRKELEDMLNKILNKKLSELLNENYFFPFESQNIYIYNIPDNFNYNDKFNFISVEVYLHTLNIQSEKKYPLNVKRNTDLFDECLRISNYIADNLKEMEDSFYINNKSRLN